MQPRFDSGVSDYVTGRATVTMYFPVDLKGRVDVCCELCRFYRPTAHRCALNDAICEYPNRYIGGQCPLEFEERKEESTDE